MKNMMQPEMPKNRNNFVQHTLYEVIRKATEEEPEKAEEPVNEVKE